MDGPLVQFLKDNFSTIFPFFTFSVGWFGSRWTMTKKERKDVEQKQFENGKELMLAQRDTFNEFASALKRYADKRQDGTVSLDDFYNISTIGEKYFYQQRITSDAILLDRVDTQSRDNTLVPSITDAVQRTLPSYYKTLSGIAKKAGFEYSGILRRENYESMYSVVEKYGKLAASDRPH